MRWRWTSRSWRVVGGVDENCDPVVDDDDDDDDDEDDCDDDVGASSVGSHASGGSRGAIDGAYGAFGAIVTAGGGDCDGLEATELRGASSRHTTHDGCGARGEQHNRRRHGGRRRCGGGSL